MSIDAGTEETFRKVRGVNLFNQVVQNLKKYRETSSSIYLKYILLDENCDEKDLLGFLQLCRELRPAQILIAGDVNKAWNHEKQYQEQIVCAALKLVEGAIKANLAFTLTDILGPSNLKEIHRRIAALPEVVSAEKQLDAALSAPKIVCYGAGGNCEIVLNQMAKAGARMPDVIWDRNAQPGQTYCAGNTVYPVCCPDFEALSEGRYGIFSTINNFETNQKLDLEMKAYGYSQLLTYDRLALALLAKEGKSYQ